MKNDEKFSVGFRVWLWGTANVAAYKFIFYAIGYVIERVLARTHSDINGFLMKKERSQQLTIAECFGIEGFE